MTDQTILLIEDNPLNLELARDVLEAAGYTVVDARTAEEGLRIAEAIVPHLILLDIRLPGMNGLDAVRSLKQDLRTRDIPVVALTAQAMAGDERTAFDAGFEATSPSRSTPARSRARCAGGWSLPEAERERRRGA